MIAIKVPSLGESIVEATVSRWAKQPGDPVAAGETVVELDTDKVTVEVPALKSGVLASQAKREGDTVKVDDLLGEVDETAVPAPAPAAVPATAAAAVSAPATVSASTAATPPATAAALAPAAATAAGAVRAAPSAQ